MTSRPLQADFDGDGGPDDLVVGRRFDVVVVGGTPGGVASAVAAARNGRTVAVTEHLPVLGGMLTNGLGKTDIETLDAVGGLFRRFVDRVLDHYVSAYGPEHENVALCRGGYYYEPSVAQSVLDAMVAEYPTIEVLTGHRLDAVVRTGHRVAAIRVTDLMTGETMELSAEVFIDGTYEGDLLASAGAQYRLGRESRGDFDELHAGVIYMDHQTGVFMPGSTGVGDERLQAYTFRLCLTEDPANQAALQEPPPNYDRTRYLGYVDDWRAGRMDPPSVIKDGRGYYGPTFGTVVRALSMAELPNKKFDVNMNPRPLGFVFAEESDGYVEATPETRNRIIAHIRNLTLGLLYFLQNDEAVPEEQRALARRYHPSADEFVHNDNFPHQLYVREARRLVGEYTLTERDVTLGAELGRTTVHVDSIASGEFPIDSFPVRKAQPGHTAGLEGYVMMLDHLTFPYQIPYRIMVPETVDGLLVPVAASTTHIAFSTIRLEPTWMALGEAAGTAAHLAIRDDCPVRSVDIRALQAELLRGGQVITYLSDMDRTRDDWAALQICGTLGFFNGYEARPDEPVDVTTGRRWLALAFGREGEEQGRRLESDPVDRDELRAALDAVRPGFNFEASTAAVTRGELCRLIDRALNAAASGKAP